MPSLRPRSFAAFGCTTGGARLGLVAGAAAGPAGGGLRFLLPEGALRRRRRRPLRARRSWSPASSGDSFDPTASSTIHPTSRLLTPGYCRSRGVIRVRVRRVSPLAPSPCFCMQLRTSSLRWLQSQGVDQEDEKWLKPLGNPTPGVDWRARIGMNTLPVGLASCMHRQACDQDHPRRLRYGHHEIPSSSRYRLSSSSELRLASPFP